jgi:hypothetical protein
MKRHTPTRPAKEPADGLPVCEGCGLLIYPPMSIGRASGKGCTCTRPKPMPGLLPRDNDAEQLALFPSFTPPRKQRIT